MFSLESFLWIGFIFYIFSWSGNIPVLNDLLQMFDIGRDIWGAIIFKILGGMLLGLTRLLESNDPINVSISFWLVGDVKKVLVFIDFK